MNKRLLTFKQAADYIGVEERTLKNWTYSTKGKEFTVRPRKLGRLTRFDVRDLDQFIDSLNYTE